MWLHLPQRKGQKHMGNHSPTAGMPSYTHRCFHFIRAHTQSSGLGEENSRGSSSTKLLSSLTCPGKCPNDRSDQLQCCGSGNHISYWNKQQSNTQSHILHCRKNCLGLILQKKSYQHSYKKKLLYEQKRKTKRPMHSGTSWRTLYLLIVVVQSLTHLVASHCNPMDYSTPGCPALHCLPEFAQTLSIESVMLRPSHPLLPPSPFTSIFPSIRVFSKKSVLRIRQPKYQSFSFSISPSREYSGLISFRIEWFDLLRVPWTARRSNIFQHIISYQTQPYSLR